jgi:Zn-finger nucleic acid-binding protein
MTTTPSSLACPRCAQPLSTRPLGSLTVESCQACNGVLVTQSRLAGVLESLSDHLLATFDPDTRIDPIAHAAGTIACPSCKKPTERADYCGAHLVSFERCNRCALLWVASDELGAMTLMWARMEKRIARTKAQNQDDLSTMDALLFASRLREAVDVFLWNRVI